MKKILLTVALTASLSAYALPTYEPFTEYSSLVTANPTNAIDLCSNGLVAPGGELWGGLLFSGHSSVASGGQSPGIDILVSNYAASPFTSNALSTLLPNTFPGYPASGGAIVTLVANNAQAKLGATNSGNSAVLDFAADITRPVSGTKTLYISYLWSLAQQGQLGGGNQGRYLAFLAQSNLFEPLTPYTFFTAMFNSFNATTAPHYCGHGILQDGTSFYVGPCDTSSGRCWTSGPFVGTYNTPMFIVGAYLFNANGGKDTNFMWVNPATTGFGGPTPPGGAFAFTMTNAMSDIGGLCLIDRCGSGTSGGVGTNYLANLLVGSSWSYVTGGPEFTTSPVASTLVGPGNTVNLSGAAVAASQSVTYFWQKNGAGFIDGNGTAGGSAMVTGSQTSALTLSGVSPGDSGTYTLVATASGTGLTNIANSVLTVSDPGVLVQPQPVTVNYGGTATFSATAVTATGHLSYAWYDGSTMLQNVTQGDGSVVTGATGSVAANSVTSTLTISGVTCLDDGSYSLWVTNQANNSVQSTPATLTVIDPIITVQPPATAEFASGTTTLIIPVTAVGTGLTYNWNWVNQLGANGNGGEISGATTSALTISPPNANDVGTYFVAVNSSCGGVAVSSNSLVILDTAPTSITLSPPKLVQQVGTHLSFVATATGWSGAVHLLAQQGSTFLNAGVQGDGTSISGPGSLYSATGLDALVISNLHLPDSGTYTVYASNVAGMVSASSVLQVVPQGQLTLSSNNLIVTRVGDGYQPLSGATGNTLYLDQFTPSGGYSNTIMVPDVGTGSIVVAGAAISATENEGIIEGYLTLSSNQQYLNFGGFCYPYPFTGPDVTIGQQLTGGSTTNVRGIYALNAFGTMAMVYTNYGLYSGGNGFRCVYSTDGLTNFWTTGSAGGGTVKYVNAGPAGAQYTITTPGSGIPAMGATGENKGGLVLGLVGTNLSFSEHTGDGDTLPSLYGIDAFAGAPEPAANAAQTSATGQILNGGDNNPNDFAVSPDGMTLYLADDGTSATWPPSGTTTFGGIQRYDLVGATNWTFAYVLPDSTTSPYTNGMRGMCAYWPPGSSGQGNTGATIYATTTETNGNRIISLLDNGSTTPPTDTVLVTAEPDTFFRGIRFGPVSVPEACQATDSASTVEAGGSVDFNADVQGVFTYYFPNATGTAYNLLSPIPTTYQWYLNGTAIPGATGFSYDLTNAQSSNAGTYTFVVSNNVFTPVTNSPGLVLTVTPFSLTANLVGWFKLSDGSGTNAADSSVYADNGYLQNFPLDNSEWVAGLGSADALDYANVDTNNDNVVVVPDAPQLNFSNNATFTLACWVNVTSNNLSVINDSALVTKGYGNGGEQYDLDIYTGYLRFFVRNPGGTVFVINATSVVMPTNQWVHVAATCDGTAGVMNLYTNAQLVGTASGPSSLIFTTTNLSIGNRTPSNTNGYLFPIYGEMQDVRLYDVALGQSEIQSIYNVLAPPTTPTSPQITSVSLSGTSLTISAINGTPNGPYRLMETTNLTNRNLTTWTPVMSGSFNGSGGVTLIYTINTNIPQEFFSIQNP